MMQNWILSIITPVFGVTSEIILIYWFAAQETFLIINIQNSIIFVKTVIPFSRIFRWVEHLKEQHSFQINTFYCHFWSIC